MDGGKFAIEVDLGRTRSIDAIILSPETDSRILPFRKTEGREVDEDAH